MYRTLSYLFLMKFLVDKLIRNSHKQRSQTMKYHTEAGLQILLPELGLCSLLGKKRGC